MSSDKKINEKMESIILTKRIAKNGKQNILILPTFLKEHLKPRTLVRVTIEVLEQAQDPQDTTKSPTQDVIQNATPVGTAGDANA